MDDAEKASFEAQSQTIRAELKAWETSWAQTHDGSKPGRSDIKSNPEIAQKYKQYNKLRDIIAGRIPPPPPPKQDDDDMATKKRKAERPPAQTPSKRAKHSGTPSKQHQLQPPADPDLLATPSISRKLFSPQSASSIAPTPRRDGRVLGLFDQLVERELANSPSKRHASSAVPEVVVSRLPPNTPRKRAGESDAEDRGSKLGRTPMSTSKRQHLDTFMTPLKKTSGNAQTPSSSRQQFSTPSFLKRHVAPMPMVDENGDLPPAQPIRLPRKPLVRGLSAIVASLRKVEEEQLDDDLEALHEMENEAMGLAPKRPPPPPPPKKESEPAREEDILVADSQALPALLGAFDDEALYDSPEEEQRDRNGQPLKIFKKKGQKRTTRLVNMRPTRVRRPVVEERLGSGVQRGEVGVVPETQLLDPGLQPPAEQQEGPEDFGSDVDFAASDTDLSDEEPSRRKQANRKPAKGSKEKKEGAAKKDEESKEGPVKRAARKVSAMAHANFRRLKLKNTGAKGGPGYNSRFRRRR